MDGSDFVAYNHMGHVPLHSYQDNKQTRLPAESRDIKMAHPEKVRTKAGTYLVTQSITPNGPYVTVHGTHAGISPSMFANAATNYETGSGGYAIAAC